MYESINSKNITIAFLIELFKSIIRELLLMKITNTFNITYEQN